MCTLHINYIHNKSPLTTGVKFKENQLHVKFCQILSNKLSRSNPPNTCIHFNGSVGQILWENKTPHKVVLQL